MYKPNIFKRNFCTKETQYQNRITKSSNSMKEMFKELGLEEAQHVSGPIKVGLTQACALRSAVQAPALRSAAYVVS